MADTPKSSSGSLPAVDVSTITDPDVRRVIRQVVVLNQQLSAQIKQQQNEIEALRSRYHTVGVRKPERRFE